VPDHETLAQQIR